MGALTRGVLIGALSGGLSLAAVVAAHTQEQPARSLGPPPAWDSLIPCAQKADPAEGFACYQAAMRAAGYKPTEQEATQRRRGFGLTLPFKHAQKEPRRPSSEVAQAAGGAAPSGKATPEAAVSEAAAEDANKITVQLSQVALIPPQNRLLLVTTDGAIWEQRDDEAVSPRPKPGQTIRIEKSRFGGYFCWFDRLTKVRCLQTH